MSDPNRFGPTGPEMFDFSSEPVVNPEQVKLRELSGEEAIEFLDQASQCFITRETLELAGVSRITLSPAGQVELFEERGATLAIFFADWHELALKTGEVEFDWSAPTKTPFELKLDDLGSDQSRERAGKILPQLLDLHKASAYLEQIGRVEPLEGDNDHKRYISLVKKIAAASAESGRFFEEEVVEWYKDIADYS